MRHEMSMQETFQLAEMLSRTQGILPPTIRTPGECVAVILAGRELGLPAMSSLRLITLLKGKVTIDSAGQLGLMQAAGAKVEWLKDGSDGKEARLRITRPANPPFETHYTIDMARTAGLLSNQTWQKYPQAMLRARCVSAAGKAYMADVLAGVYLPGEIDGDQRPEDGVIEHQNLAGGAPMLQVESRPVRAEAPRALAADAAPVPAAEAPQQAPEEPLETVDSLVEQLYKCTAQDTYNALYAKVGKRRWKTYSETEQLAITKAAAHARDKIARAQTEAAEREAAAREAAEAEEALSAQEALDAQEAATDPQEPADTKDGAL